MSTTIAENDVLSLMFTRSCQYGERPALSYFEGDRWLDVRFQELQQRALRLSNYLIELGVERDDKVAVLSEPCPEWGIVLFACIRTGAILVPLDVKLTGAELNEIVLDCRPKVLFASSSLCERARQLALDSRSIEHVFLTGAENNDDSSASRSLCATGSLSIDEMVPSNAYEGRNRNADETALIVYTSGTTARPKGVMIAFKTLIFQVRKIEESLNTGAQDVFLSVLPINHLLELTCGFLGPLYFGSRIYYAPGLYPQEILAIIADKGVTWMVVVPAVLKALKRTIEISGQSAAKIFGSHFKGFLCGGAPLEAEVEQFFESLEVSVCQGYGLTETGPMISANTPRDRRSGSVGRPWKGVEVVVDGTGDTGEILTRGEHVMQGYFERPELTAEAIDAQGWFHTGDLGRLDEEGYLYVTGRLKNLIVTAAGKKIQPEEVEEVLTRGDLLKDVLILGDKCKLGLMRGCEEVVAVVVPGEELSQLLDEDEALAHMNIREEVERLSAPLAQFKRPARLFVHRNDFPRTTSSKVRRDLVAKWIKGREAIKPWI